MCGEAIQGSRNFLLVQSMNHQGCVAMIHHEE